MSKAILLLDMPKCCIDCPLHYYDIDSIMPFWCGACCKELKTDDFETYKPDWCPLKEAPEIKKVDEEAEFIDMFAWENGFDRGYNACIDEILGGGE